MGNTELKPQASRETEIFHQKFKKLDLLESTQEMILSIPYEQKQDIEEWEKLLKSIKQCDPEFLLMPKKYMLAQQGICGTSGVIKIVYDSFRFSFEQQIRNHAQKFKHFQESEVWYLLFAIISAVKQMNRVSLKVGDIRPYNIFVNQNGQIKLSGVYSWPKEIQNFLKTKYDKTVTYLAPQQLNLCPIGDKGKRSHIVGESFSVGLTLLHTCLLRQMSDLYNIKKWQISKQNLDRKIKQLQSLSFWNQQTQKNQKYSPSLINIIIRLLDFDQNNRLTTLKVYDLLEPSAEEILNLKNFQIPQISLSSQQITYNNDKDQYRHFISRSSPQYSTIPKKQYHEIQSLAFQTSDGFLISAKNFSNNLEKNQRQTPQKSKNIKQKLSISLSSQKKKIYPFKTVEPQRGMRQSIQPSVNLTSIAKVDASYLPSNIAKAPTEFRINEGQNLSYGPSIGFNIHQPSHYQKKYEIPIPLNGHKASHAQYETRYQTLHPNQYRISSDKPALKPKTGQIQSNYMYKPSQFFVQPSAGNYPFALNVNLANSQYTAIERTIPIGIEKPKISFGVNEQQRIAETRGNYQTSVVKAIGQGQTNLYPGMRVSIGIEDKTTNDQLDLLRKIDEQLSRSKQMYQI